MAHTLLEDHLGTETTFSGQGDLPLLYPECGLYAVQSGQVTFLVAEFPATGNLLHGTSCDQFDGIRFLAGIGLPSHNGQQHIFLHP